MFPRQFVIVPFDYWQLSRNFSAWLTDISTDSLTSCCRSAVDQDSGAPQGVGAVAGADVHVLEAILSPVPQRIRLHHVAQSGRVLAAEEQGKAIETTVFL